MGVVCMSELGKRVERLRIQMKISQADLGKLAAKAMGRYTPFHQTAIAHIEDGTTRNPQKVTIEALAKALGTTPEYLMVGIIDEEEYRAAFDLARSHGITGEQLELLIRTHVTVANQVTGK